MKTPFSVRPLRTFTFALLFLLAMLSNGLFAPRSIHAAPPAQSPVVVNAVDNDPDNKLWNCETQRVPFGDERVDHSRCFSFRYAVPREEIQHAVVRISLSTLGANQDTDATIMAVGKPYAPCAWGQGQMPGCVGLHGGFQGTHKSLNLNLLDIACDASVQNSPEAQTLVRDQLRTGTLHMLLQDDTAVYSAQLVLNGDTASTTCGASTNALAPVSQLPPGNATRAAPVNPTLQFLPELNRLLTDTPAPRPPDPGGALTATLVGAGLFSLLALSNYLFSAPAFAPRPVGAGTAGPAADAHKNALDSQTALGHDARASQAISGPASSSSTAAGATSTTSLAGAAPPESTAAGEWLAAAGEQAVDSLPDARDTVADKLIELVGDSEKHRRLEAERKRLEQRVADRTLAHQQAAGVLKQVIDGGGDYPAAQRAWQQAGTELQTAQSDLAQFLKSFPDKPA